MESATIQLNRDTFVRRLFIGCLTIVLLLALGDFIFSYKKVIDAGQIRRFFNITREDSLPTLCAILLWTFITLTSTALALTAEKTKRFRWWVATLFLGFLGFDDGSKFHERIGTYFSNVFKEGGVENYGTVSTYAESFPSYNWHMFISPIIAITGCIVFALFLKLLSTTRLRIQMFAAFAILGLAVGIDFLEGIKPLIDWTTETLSLSSDYHVLHIVKLTEETIEMIGMSLILVTLASELLLKEKIVIEIT